MTREQAVNFLKIDPYKLGHLLGFTKLTPLHNEWIKDMVFGKSDRTLQAHRGSYKTTCVALALAEIMVLFPNDKLMFMRKTDTDTKEIVRQIQKIMRSDVFRYFVASIYNVDLNLTTATQTQISTNLTTDPRGAEQLSAMGVSGSLTGKHYDRIFTDDIVNIADRISRAEREHTKLVYQELQNIKNRETGRIFNTGTPWHKDDCFTLMPDIKQYDCYSTGLISNEELSAIKEKMTASLFAANYELKHIADEDHLFAEPQFTDNISLIEQGIAHIDAAYGGADGTAFTICHKVQEADAEGNITGVKYYVFGKLFHKHVDDCLEEIIGYRSKMLAGKIYCENNGDKGYLGKELRSRNERVVCYHEDMNKYLKITSYLKATWKDVIFIKGTDEEYINQICDYTENAEHDDAPDSLASIVRVLWNKKDSNYVPIYM